LENVIKHFSDHVVKQGMTETYFSDMANEAFRHTFPNSLDHGISLTTNPLKRVTLKISYHCIFPSTMRFLPPARQPTPLFRYSGRSRVTSPLLLPTTPDTYNFNA
jgi:hypothetical protein